MSTLAVDSITDAVGSGAPAFPNGVSGNIVSTGALTATGIYLGGTGSANLLDDYEEGTFTLSATAVLGNLLGTWPTSVTANYTKIGNKVTIVAALGGTNFGFSALTGYYKWNGLPFTPTSSGGAGVCTTSSLSSATAFRVYIDGDFWFYAPNNTTGTNGGTAIATYFTAT